MRTDGSNSREVNQRIQGFRHAATARAASGWKWIATSRPRRQTSLVSICALLRTLRSSAWMKRARFKRSIASTGAAALAGRAERHGFEYFRHGTFRSMRPQHRSGEVLGKTANRHTAPSNASFCRRWLPVWKRGGKIHIIADNLSTHKTKAVEAFCASTRASVFTLRPLTLRGSISSKSGSRRSSATSLLAASSNAGRIH